MTCVPKQYSLRYIIESSMNDIIETNCKANMHIIGKSKINDLPVSGRGPTCP